jgi:N6-adenosine-specific RNA methylase IME4
MAAAGLSSPALTRIPREARKSLRRHPPLCSGPAGASSIACALSIAIETGMDRSADNHYPTMAIQELMLLPVSSVAAADSVMFLWATAPHLANAIALMAHWGFAYKSRCVWVKDKAGTGYWFRDLAEELLVGTRGRIPAPAQGDQYGGAIEAPVGRHSVKPVYLHEMIEDLFPNLPKLEMFARQQRDGWDCWGNEVDSGAQRDHADAPPRS